MFGKVRAQQEFVSKQGEKEKKRKVTVPDAMRKSACVSRRVLLVFLPAENRTPRKARMSCAHKTLGPLAVDSTRTCVT